MAKITIGGKRLGSGSKMEVYIPEFDRSSHDQGFVFTTDQAFGTLVPALCNLGTRGDVFYLDDITSIVRTLPTNGPVFGSVKQQIDVFAAPLRLYIGALHNNATGIGLKMAQIKMPVEQHITTVYKEDLQLKNPNIPSVAPDSLSAYLGKPGSKTGANFANVNYNQSALFELMYWDIYKNYYANKQEEEGVVVKTKTAEEGVLNRIVIYDNVENRTIATQSGPQTTDGVNEADGKTIAGKTIKFRTNRKLITEDLQKLYLYTTQANTEKKELLYNNSMWTYNGEETNINFYEYSFSKPATPATPITIKWNEAEGYGGGLPWRGEANISLERFPLQNIDKMREAILAAPIGVPLVINKVGGGMTPYNIGTEQFVDKGGKKREARAQTMCGLAVKCHLSDIFNNWLQTDWIDGENGINDLTSIDTSDGSFTINEFILDYKLFKMMNRIAISDGSYDAWQTAVYGQEGRVISESPIYCGGYSSEIGFDEVVSQSATEAEPLGSLAGRGSQQNATKQGGKNIKIVCDEAMLIMVISSFTPRTTYSQNRQWWTELESMDDLHKPDLDGIAFQNLTTGMMTTWGDVVNADGSTTEKVVGKQTPWVEYTTAVNQSYGDFAAGMPLEHLVINRSYQGDDTAAGVIENATTYIDPTEFNVIFADEELTAKPFWVQIGFNLTSRRKMSAVQIPNL